MSPHLPAGHNLRICSGSSWQRVAIATAMLWFMLISTYVCNASSGRVVAWGCNEPGQPNAPPHATNIVAVAAGHHHGLALRADHTVISWGSQTNVPPQATNVIAISACESNNLALRADGTVVAWGDNAYGENQ